MTEDKLRERVMLASRHLIPILREMRKDLPSEIRTVVVEATPATPDPDEDRRDVEIGILTSFIAANIVTAILFLFSYLLRINGFVIAAAVLPWVFVFNLGFENMRIRDRLKRTIRIRFEM